MLESLERQHGEQEKALQRQAAQLTRSLDTTGRLTQMWRYISGRTRQEKESLAQVTVQLAAIRTQKERAQANFERDRQARLEALRQEQEQRDRQAAEAMREQSQARAVGDGRTQKPRPAQRQPENDREARRREFFRQRALQRQREQETEREKTSEPIAPQFNEQTKETPQTEHEPPVQKTTELDRNAEEARRAAFMERRRRDRSHDRDGPDLEQ